MLTLAIALLAFFLQGCGPEQGGAPARKKVPELTDLSNEFEGNGYEFQTTKTNNINQYGFTSTNANMNFMGEQQSCVVVSLRSAAMDSVAFNLVKTYGILASPLINEWSKRERKGLVFDLRENAGNEIGSSKAEYVLKSTSGIEVPIVFVWDRRSASRAVNYTQILENFSGIDVHLLSSN